MSFSLLSLAVAKFTSYLTIYVSKERLKRRTVLFVQDSLGSLHFCLLKNRKKEKTKAEKKKDRKNERAM